MKPILFNSEMVQAILEGRKTQTRRPINSIGNRLHNGKLLCDWGLSEKPEKYSERKCQLWNYLGRFSDIKIGDWVWTLQSEPDDTCCHPLKAPCNENEILYVRETFCKNDHINPDVPFLYKADSMCKAKDSTIRWTPSIHMPKKAARIFLKAISVTAERIQSISDVDAWSEGINKHEASLLPYINPNNGLFNCQVVFANLWDSIYEKQRLGWGMNPFVWVTKFERCAVESTR